MWIFPIYVARRLGAGFFSHLRSNMQIKIILLGFQVGVFAVEYQSPYTFTTKMDRKRDLLAFCCGGIRTKRYKHNMVEGYDFSTMSGLLHFAFLVGLQDTLRVKKWLESYKFQEILENCRFVNSLTDIPF